MKILLALLCLCSTAYSQNWAVRTYATVSTNDPFRVQGGPTNWASEWKNIGTNLVVTSNSIKTAAWPFYSFIGNDAAKASWISTRQGTYGTWWTNTFNPAETNSVFLARSNVTWMIGQRDLLRSNAYFWSTNRTIQNTLTLSNQLQTLIDLIRINDNLTPVR